MLHIKHHLCVRWIPLDAHAPVSATACSQMRDSERKTMDRIERELEAAKVLILVGARVVQQYDIPNRLTFHPHHTPTRATRS